MKNTDINKVPLMGKIKGDRASSYDFLIGDVLVESWKRVHGTKATFWKGMIVYILMLFGLFIVGGAINYLLIAQLGAESNIPRCFIWIWDIFTYLIVMPTMVGFSYLGIRRAVNLPINTKQIFFPYDHYLRVIGAFTLVFAMVYGIMFIGFFMAVITQNFFSVNGVVPAWAAALSIGMAILTTFLMYYLFIAFMFAPLLIVEKGFTIMRALKSSFLGFKQHWFKILITHLCMLFIYIISAIPFGIGIIWTIPMMFILIGVFYRMIFGVEEAR